MAIGTPQSGAYTERPAETSTSVPYPATVNLGDFIVLKGATSATATGSVTLPSGFTLGVDLANSGIPPNLFVAYKYADGTEGGTNLTVAHISTASSWELTAYAGVDQTTPLDVAIGTVAMASASTSMVLPSVTVATNGAALIAVGAHNSTTATATPPSGFTETGDRISGSRSFESSYKLNNAAGASGTKTILWSVSARGVGALIALRPALAPFHARPTVNRVALIRASIY